jgi:hypothetical protein
VIGRSAGEDRPPAAAPLGIEKGTSLLVPAAAPPYRMQGEGRLFKATVP